MKRSLFGFFLFVVLLLLAYYLQEGIAQRVFFARTTGEDWFARILCVSQIGLILIIGVVAFILQMVYLPKSITLTTKYFIASLFTLGAISVLILSLPQMRCAGNVGTITLLRNRMTIVGLCFIAYHVKHGHFPKPYIGEDCENNWRKTLWVDNFVGDQDVLDLTTSFLKDRATVVQVLLPHDRLREQFVILTVVYYSEKDYVEYVPDIRYAEFKKSGKGSITGLVPVCVVTKEEIYFVKQNDFCNVIDTTESVPAVLGAIKNGCSRDFR